MVAGMAMRMHDSVSTLPDVVVQLVCHTEQYVLLCYF